jgi:hypothetical protein
MCEDSAQRRTDRVLEDEVVRGDAWQPRHNYLNELARATDLVDSEIELSRLFFSPIDWRWFPVEPSVASGVWSSFL